MNLHDIKSGSRRDKSAVPSFFPANRAPGRSDIGIWMETFDPFRDYEDRFGRAYIRHPSRVTGPIDWPIDIWRESLAETVSPQETRSQQRALELLREISCYSDELSFLRSPIRERSTFGVSPEDYMALQSYVAQDGGYMGPVYDRRGTMMVYGVTVVPVG